MHTPPAATRAAYQALLTAELGDIVTLPDGRQLTIRAVERRLAVTAGNMTGFLLAGEIGPQATLLSIPANPDSAVLLYTPIDYIPAHARDARLVCQGVISYWAPHLPGTSGAQGELGYKVCAVRGQIDPMVLIWRGAERIVFVKTAVATPADLRFLALPRNPNATEKDATRYAARVVDPALGEQTVDERERELAGGGGLYERIIRRR